MNRFIPKSLETIVIEESSGQQRCSQKGQEGSRDDLWNVTNSDCEEVALVHDREEENMLWIGRSIMVWQHTPILQYEYLEWALRLETVPSRRMESFV